MSVETAAESIPLEASSPYELRVDLSKDVPDNVVKSSLKTGDMGFLHSYTTGSAVDGPGVRLVAWTSGCQFKCVYCHNPDTWNLMNGIPVPIEKAIEGVAKYRHALKVMNGGFTLSGGEPLMQDRFAARLFAAVKEMGVHTALDTNGFLGERLSDDELDSIDLVLLCIKHMDPEKHMKLVGKELGPTLDFAHRLAERNRPMWLRFVLVPGRTDSEEDVDRMARFVAEMGNCKRVDILPFHQMGRYKWERLGLSYELDNVEPPTAAVIERVCEQFRARGLEAY
ncbi:MAG TPA: pyruvate formate-lyase-activating protein [Pyrinomonadaceae bacterium]|nr:pyruvate formate-lyase-activating protein [Pyrinomonadaceae bacterium]